MNDQLLKKVKEIFSRKHIPGHDIDHALRVGNYAKLIARNEGYSSDEAELAGLLHDLGRTVVDESKGHAQASVPLAKKLLDDYTDLSENKKEEILHAISVHSDKETTGKLANILQDADKIDGLGAIGVLRAFIPKYYLPEYDEQSFLLTEETTSDHPRTLYEQLLFQQRWMNMLYTDTAKSIAREKYDYMKNYTEKLKSELKTLA